MMSAEEIRAIRARWGMTQDQFAHALGISDRSRVSDMENGRRKVRPTLEKLIRATDAAREIVEEVRGDDEP